MAYNYWWLPFPPIRTFHFCLPSSQIRHSISKIYEDSLHRFYKFGLGCFKDFMSLWQSFSKIVIWKEIPNLWNPGASRPWFQPLALQAKSLITPQRHSRGSIVRANTVNHLLLPNFYFRNNCTKDCLEKIKCRKYVCHMHVTIIIKYKNRSLLNIKSRKSALCIEIAKLKHHTQKTVYSSPYNHSYVTVTKVIHNENHLQTGGQVNEVPLKKSKEHNKMWYLVAISLNI